MLPGKVQRSKESLNKRFAKLQHDVLRKDAGKQASCHERTCRQYTPKILSVKLLVSFIKVC